MILTPVLYIKDYLSTLRIKRNLTYCIHFFYIYINILFKDTCGIQLYKQKRKRGVALLLDDRHVVAYNPFLLLKYHCHINIEYCFGQKSCKYIFKYFLKGMFYFLYGLYIILPCGYRKYYIKDIIYFSFIYNMNIFFLSY
jgi:hypothetical protein